MQLNRRDWLRQSVGTFLLPASILNATPAQKRAARIRDVQLLPVRATERTVWLFVRVTTDSGLTGWGEASDAFSFANTTKAQANQMEAALREFVELMKGRSPFEIEYYRQVRCAAFDSRR